MRFIPEGGGPVRVNQAKNRLAITNDEIMRKLVRLLRTFSKVAVVAVGLVGVDAANGGVAYVGHIAPVGKFYLTIKNQSNQASVSVRMTLGWGGIGVVKKLPDDPQRAE